MKFFKHLKTVTRHRREVRKLCFKCGLIRQGLTHDLSKFSRAEFRAGVKYYQGNRSPQAREREVLGYSAAWLHHKGKNKHHFEYWTDNGLCGGVVTVEMPPKYFAEMVCDRIAASKIYKGKDYNDACPWEYFEGRKDGVFMHPNTSERLECFLTMLKDEGEEKTLKELKKYVKENK
ncbi:MAG: catalase [Clostridia bacterium]|nr:catalase [Clostridia bacterium]